MIVPLLVEQCLEHGLKAGLLSIALDFLLSLVFFVFHLQVWHPLAQSFF